jgi:hypothetical protein
MNLELTQEERGLLARLVDAALREIGPEIRHTDHYDYKDDLKEQRRTLLRLYERLTGQTPPALAGEA